VRGSCHGSYRSKRFRGALDRNFPRSEVPTPDNPDSIE
jgi:hypothetical protein